MNMLVFDLDDTLLTSEKAVTPESIETIRLCKEKGMIIGYITARARPVAGEAFFTDKFNLPTDFISYSNGASTYAGQNLIDKNEIPYVQAMEIIAGLANNFPGSKISVRHDPWSYHKKRGSADGENWNIETGEIIKCGIFELPDYPVQRIRISFGEIADKDILNGFITENIRIYTAYDYRSAIIVSKEAAKENALKKVSEYFKIPLSKIISFGDDVNDINMLKISGIGVAMGNAIKSVKEAADHITETNDNEGVSKWIKKYLL